VFYIDRGLSDKTYAFWRACHDDRAGLQCCTLRKG
jgi:hypothetical protein